jgi:ATP-dependent helicase HrpB
MLARLPIDEHLPRIRDLARSAGAVVVVAPPGAGKTTRVAPILAQDGPVIVLQPRRVAARSIARRIAEEQGLELGGEVGWHVRFDRRSSERTRILVVTEGILTALLQSDPLLSGFRTAVLDEFHERSLHADVALALLKQAVRARPELRLVVMSATLDAAAVSGYLDGCPIVDVPGRPFPVTIAYSPGATMGEAVAEVVRDARGHVLCFLPGAGEILRVHEQLVSASLPGGTRILPLHGTLDAEAQDAALAPSTETKVILATNIAETSITVEGVSDVVDGGLHKVLRFDPERGIDRLETERIAADSAEQRAGRAGRTGPGRALRLWDPRDRLAPHRESEIARADLAPPFLDVLAWGGDPTTLEWYEAPHPERAAAAVALLERLGLASEGRLTLLGESVRRLPLPPRLARVFAACPTPRVAAVCALLAERPFARPSDTTTVCDLLDQADSVGDAPHHVRLAAREIASLARRLPARAPCDDGDEAILRALAAGFPDRIAQRRAPGSDRLLLATGHGARLSSESGVREGELLAALDVVAGRRGPGAEALVRQASLVRREWLTPTNTDVIHAFDGASLSVRAVERKRYGALMLAERFVEPEPGTAAELLVAALRERGLPERDVVLLRRIALAGEVVDLDAALGAACAGHASLAGVSLAAAIPEAALCAADRLCPETVAVPSGRRLRLDYREDGSVHLAVKLQEVFGLADGPRVGARRDPVVLDLLAPNGRPVQTTCDLLSFWEHTYPEVRRELRGRYPKHPWPEDPWAATPTHRAKSRSPRPPLKVSRSNRGDPRRSSSR